ncbi:MULTISPECIES: inositol 2-dehydrogenase [Chelatococcus]|uniref:Myo-inositol 2-dehydrogenase/D-chiro-inositol 1-dehydrogenase n=1 Tax=Chelatococcus caeni TaxID=1348468 RepID=A0A840BS36_9HYPH|nr:MULTISPECIES: inositol 2-dehydrogenase [Chelatococcus]ALA18269.1 inositol 2-dehydrogenase [Chelatococcus sp. CO-6]MBB4015403.1 myo-inositol 2-dehydrogenase/D-chiro-inositol 1-dehydrogenase [Chelatococcus caeni]
MLNIGLLGAGRIGITHARAVTALPDARITAVFDPVDAAAAAAQALTGARRASVEEIMADKDIAAVIVATPTDLHATQVEEAARAGKAIFCEKPIDLSSARAEACLAVVREHNARLMLGFNRRFDPSFARLKAEVEAGAVGKVELVQITSRDPAPPPVDYIKRSGGLFRDMMIHDFDMARFLLGEEVTEVFATGAALVDAAIGAAGDVDTATATLKTASGRIAVITNSRRATYGYDQRLEVHGEKGMIQAGNETATTLTRANASGFTSDPLLDFFMQRYAEAYRLELAAFCRLAAGEDIAVPTGEDGLAALRLADAAVKSLASGQSVRL